MTPSNHKTTSLLPNPATDLAVVCWSGPDERVVAGHPLPRPRAEALATAFARFFPGDRYWVEPIPWLRRRDNA